MDGVVVAGGMTKEMEAGNCCFQTLFYCRLFDYKLDLLLRIVGVTAVGFSVSNQTEPCIVFVTLYREVVCFILSLEIFRNFHFLI